LNSKKSFVTNKTCSEVKAVLRKDWQFEYENVSPNLMGKGKASTIKIGKGLYKE